MVRTLVAILILASTATSIAFLFWHQELQYNLPTPVPKTFSPVNLGTSVSIDKLPPAKGYFLHFYSADCPCSRFNSRHVKSLIRSYGDSVKMFIVVSKKKDLSEVNEQFEGVETILDEDGALALKCGVYSTPQAVILDENNKLYYRGNYNRSRYCTAKATNFAELSLIALMNHQPSPAFGLMATTSYGCELASHDENFEIY